MPTALRSVLPGPVCPEEGLLRGAPRPGGPAGGRRPLRGTPGPGVRGPGLALCPKSLRVRVQPSARTGRPHLLYPLRYLHPAGNRTLTSPCGDCDILERHREEKCNCTWFLLIISAVCVDHEIRIDI